MAKSCGAEISAPFQAFEIGGARLNAPSGRIIKLRAEGEKALFSISSMPYAVSRIGMSKRRLFRGRHNEIAGKFAKWRNGLSRAEMRALQAEIVKSRAHWP